MNLWAFKRYFKYYLIIVRVKVMQLLEYRADFVMGILGPYGFTALYLISLNIVFTGVNNIGGWNYNDLLVLFGTAQIIFHTQGSFFFEVEKIGSKIVTGELDKYLLRPINSIFVISTQDFQFIAVLPSILLDFVILIIGIKNSNIPIKLDLLLVYVALVLLSMGISLLVRLSIGFLAFFLSDTDQIRAVNNRLMGLMEYPGTIYPGLFKLIFFIIIPFGILGYAPASVLIEGFRTDLFIYQLIALFNFLIITTVLWKRGIKAYSSASS